jgi:hypothetical protein
VRSGRGSSEHWARQLAAPQSNPGCTRRDRCREAVDMLDLLDLLIESFTDDQHRIQGQLRDVDDNRCLFGGMRQSAGDNRSGEI